MGGVCELAKCKSRESLHFAIFVTPARRVAAAGGLNSPGGSQATPDDLRHIAVEGGGHDLSVPSLDAVLT
jgi:hypothetical protein